MRTDFDGRGLRVVATEGTTAAYTRYQVTYRSNGTLVSGVLLRPHGRGPFPAVVLNHGYIDPPYYATGQGMAREQDWLANAGFVVLHTDYRGHAAGDPATDLERELRLAYAQDSINAVLALEKLPYVDADKTAMVGRSMGGGVTMNALVAAPGLVDAAVIYASVSSSYLDNLRHFSEPNRPEAVQSLFARFGTPQEEPGLLRGLSSRTYFDRITEPVLIAPRRRRRHLPAGLVPHHPGPDARGRSARPAGHLPGRGPHLLRAVAGLDHPHHPVPPAPPRRVTGVLAITDPVRSAAAPVP